MPRLPYWVRIAFGAFLGIATLVALWLLVGRAWLTATVAALLAPIGFLGSYFAFSADRPEEGHEQVLFDKPNTIVSGVMIALFAFAGIGTAFVGGAAEEPSTAERVSQLYNVYQNNAIAFTKQELDAEALTAILDELRAESDRLALEIGALPEGAARGALATVNDALALAIDAMKLCAAGTGDECVNARLFASDAQAALERRSAA